MVLNASPPLPGKKGASFPLRDEGQPGSWNENLPKVIQLKPYWNYSWGSKLIDAQPADIEFVPMIWSGNGEEWTQQTLQNDVATQIESGKVKRLLGFNEPDGKEQANMTVECALERWQLLESVGISLVSPSCVHPGNEWMTSFMKNANETGKRVDWVGVHWYGGANFNAFTSSMQQSYEMYKRPLLVTEFAPADWNATTVESNRISAAAVLAFMKQALPWLEAQEWIAGYTWFSFCITTPQGTSSALFDEEGALTVCGRYYASIRNNTPKGDTSIEA